MLLIAFVFCEIFDLGLALAMALGKEGLKVRLMEKHSSSLEFSRAMFINSDTLKLFTPYYDVHKQLLLRGRLVNGVCLHSSLKKSEVSKCEFIGNMGPYHPIAIPQVEIEKILENTIAEQLQIHVQRNMIYKSHRIIKYNDKDVIESIIYDNTTNLEVKYYSKFLFGCDGFKSTVRQELNIPFPGTTMAESMTAADITIPSGRYHLTSDINFWALPIGFIISIRLQEILREDGIMYTRIRLACSNNSMKSDMLSLFNYNQGDMVVDWISDFTIHHYHATAHGIGSVQLAGDAVHVHSPIGGRGMGVDGIYILFNLSAIIYV